jgi:hypothetical protein
MPACPVQRAEGRRLNPDDVLWRLRHALAGVGVALLLSVPTAALLGRLLGDAMGGGYGTRVAVYAALLAYVVVGAAVLLTKVAAHETRPLSLRRAGTWFVSLWLWPALLAGTARKGARGPGDA